MGKNKIFNFCRVKGKFVHSEVITNFLNFVLTRFMRLSMLSASAYSAMSSANKRAIKALQFGRSFIYIIGTVMAPILIPEGLRYWLLAGHCVHHQWKQTVGVDLNIR